MAPGIGPGSRVGWRGALVFQDDFLGGTPDTIGRANLSIQATGTLVNIAAVGNVSLSLASAGTLTAYIPTPRVAVVQTSNARGGGATSINLFLTGVTAGNALILSLNYYRDGATGPTAVLTNGMTTGDGAATLVAKSGLVTLSGYSGTSQIFIQPNVTGGNKTVNVAFTGDPYTWATLIEVSGLDPVTPVDWATTATGTGTAISIDGLAEPVQDSSLLLFLATQHSDNSNTTLSTPAGHTLIDNEIDGSTYADGVSSYQVVNNFVVPSAASTSNRSAQWAAVLAVFKPPPPFSDELVGDAPISINASGTLRSYGHAGPDIGAVVVKAPDGTTPLATQTTTPVDTAVSGSTFVIAAMYDNTTTSSASDNMGNTYILVGTQSFIDPVRLSVYVCEDGDGGAGHTFSHTTAATSPYTSVFGVETFTPGASAPIYGSFTSNRDGATPFTLAGPTTTVNNELLLDFAQYFHDGLADGQDNAGFTKVVEQPNGTLANAGALFARTASTPGTYSSSVVAAASEATLQLMMSLLPGASASGDVVGSTTLSVTAAATLAGLAPVLGATALSLAPAGALAASGRLVGATSLTITPAAAASTIVSMVGLATLALGQSGALVATGRLIAATTATITPNGVLTSGLAAAGTTALSLTTAGALAAVGRLVGAGTLAITPNGVLRGNTALVGATTATITSSGTIVGLQPGLSGTAAITIAPSAIARATGRLIGAATLSIVPTATGATRNAIVGTTALAIAPAGFLSGTAPATGSATLTVAPSAALRGTGRLVGTTTLSIAAAASTSSFSALVGNATLLIAPSATGTRYLAATGTAALSITPTAALTGTGRLIGSATLSVAPAGTLVGLGTGALVGTAPLSVVPTATLRGTGRLAGTTPLSITGSGVRNATANLAGAAPMAFNASATGNLIGEIDGAAVIAIAMVAQLMGTASILGATTISITGRATPEGYIPPVGDDFVIEWFDTIEPVVWAEEAVETIVLAEDAPTVAIGYLAPGVIVWEDAP